ncbi:hypothetical protein AGMMS49944_09660 [Spirochaetia bacterium]|nr:hypothetical protein AGMMS49944_09660 [Spirochaetia bacterium]
MTVREIAEAVGKTNQSVLNWIGKIVEPNFLVLHQKNLDVETQNADDTNRILRLVNLIREKAGSKDPHHPADYTFEEVLLIIEAGLGKNAAGVYRASASGAENGVNRDYAGLLEAVERLIDSKLAVFTAQNEQKQLPPPPELPDGDKIRAFVKKYLEITGRDANFITLDDAFMLYQRETGDGIPRNILAYQLLRAYPVLSEKMRKAEGRREKVITGCRPQEQLTTGGALFSMDAHYKAMFDD